MAFQPYWAREALEKFSQSGDPKDLVDVLTRIVDALDELDHDKAEYEVSY